MYESQQHEMQMETVHPSGAEEWYCPMCGRRILMQWPPAYKRIILDPGDRYASHSGSKGGLRIGLLQATQGEESAFDEELRPSNTDLHDADPIESEETELTDTLRPWLQWLENVNLDL